MSNAVQIRRVSQTPVLDTALYATGDQVGALLAFDNFLSPDGLGSRNSLVTLLDKAKQSSALDLFFFDYPVTLVAADQAAADISDADMEHCLGVVNILAADYDVLANSSIATVSINFPLNNVGWRINQTPAGLIPKHRIYVNIVARGGPTYGAANALVLTLTSETDQ